MKTMASRAQAASLACIFSIMKKVVATATAFPRFLPATPHRLKAIAGSFRWSTATPGVENIRRLSKYPLRRNALLFEAFGTGWLALAGYFR